MFHSTLFFPGLLVCGCLVACSPEMNWRDVRPVSTRLQALMPCRPDDAMRAVPLGGRLVDMHFSGCDAGGATFVVGWAAMPVENIGAALGEWQDSTLLRAAIPAGPDAPNGRPFVVQGAQQLPQSLRLQATGRSPDGRALPLDAAWFASAGSASLGLGPEVFFAAIYGAPSAPDAAGSFFSGLRLR